MSHFIRDTVRTGLDLSRIMDGYAEERGYPPYHPGMMVALLLYAYSQGVYSSRRIAGLIYVSDADRVAARIRVALRLGIQTQ